MREQMLDRLIRETHKYGFLEEVLLLLEVRARLIELLENEENDSLLKGAVA